MSAHKPFSDRVHKKVENTASDHSSRYLTRKEEILASLHSEIIWHTSKTKAVFWSQFGKKSKKFVLLSEWTPHVSLVICYFPPNFHVLHLTISNPERNNALSSNVSISTHFQTLEVFSFITPLSANATAPQMFSQELTALSTLLHISMHHFPVSYTQSSIAEHEIMWQSFSIVGGFCNL